MPVSFHFCNVVLYISTLVPYWFAIHQYTKITWSIYLRLQHSAVSYRELERLLSHLMWTVHKYTWTILQTTFSHVFTPVKWKCIRIWPLAILCLFYTVYVLLVTFLCICTKAHWGIGPCILAQAINTLLPGLGHAIYVKVNTSTQTHH